MGMSGERATGDQPGPDGRSHLRLGATLIALVVPALMMWAWTSPRLDGALFGEPLISSGQVFVATENDTVYALSSSTGAVLWSTHLGTPVPLRSLPCGNITPTVGITGTPVIDQARSEIFVVADELRNGNPTHMLVGLDTTSGRTEMTLS